MKTLLIQIDEWLSSPHVQGMDALEERGYLRLLLYAAQQEDRGLPIDDQSLGVISLLGKQWNKPTRERKKRGNVTSGQKLRALFVERNQRLYDAELVAQCNAKNQLIDARRRAGHLGNQRRWGNRKGSHERVANRSQVRSQTDQQNLQQVRATAGRSPGRALYLRYEEFLQRWPADQRGVDLGAQMWISLVDSGEITDANIGDVFDGLERWKTSQVWTKDNGKFIPAIANPQGTGWLQRRAWKDHPKPGGDEF